MSLGSATHRAVTNANVPAACGAAFPDRTTTVRPNVPETRSHILYPIKSEQISAQEIARKRTLVDLIGRQLRLALRRPVLFRHLLRRPAHRTVRPCSPVSPRYLELSSCVELATSPRAARSCGSSSGPRPAAQSPGSSSLTSVVLRRLWPAALCAVVALLSSVSANVRSLPASVVPCTGSPSRCGASSAIYSLGGTAQRCGAQGAHTIDPAVGTMCQVLLSLDLQCEEFWLKACYRSSSALMAACPSWTATCPGGCGLLLFWNKSAQDVYDAYVSVV